MVVDGMALMAAADTATNDFGAASPYPPCLVSAAHTGRGRSRTTSSVPARGMRYTSWKRTLAGGAAKIGQGGHAAHGVPSQGERACHAKRYQQLGEIVGESVDVVRV